MLDYQKIVIAVFIGLILSTLIIGLIEKNKANKEYIAELERKNEQLREKIYRLKFNAELRGLKIDV